MNQLIANSNIVAVIGMGVTGRSVARYLLSVHQPFVWMDTRVSPPNIDSILTEFTGVHVELGPLKAETLSASSEIIVSPGLNLTDPAIEEAKRQGISIIGDIDLYLRVNTAKVIAITGSNAKSTVTKMVGEMVEADGKTVAVGGNIGTPVLDLLLEGQKDIAVLELSSFQLESISALNADVATVLNVSEDHMDRYESLPFYHRAKQRVYFGAKNIVVNRADALTRPPLSDHVKEYSFGLNAPDRNGFGLLKVAGEEFLAHEFKALMPVKELSLPGRHNIENALSALALGYAAGLSLEAMLSTLRTFKGLQHRCDKVAQFNQVSFYNDSKGTNVGATLAALTGLKDTSGKIVLIAGGVGKGADFTPLKKSFGELRALILMGEDAQLIAKVAQPEIETVYFAKSMLDAVKQSVDLAHQNDTVLLSPACASFDMFKNFEERGDAFVAAVKQVLT